MRLERTYHITSVSTASTIENTESSKITTLRLFYSTEYLSLEPINEICISSTDILFNTSSCTW
jgi:hypothetical protein